MIYNDEFKKFLEDNLGKVKITSKNWVVKCPYCELDKEKKHNHLYISLESPIFHCFYAKCGASGTISKLVRKINGTDTSEKFINRDKIKEISKIKLTVKNETKNIIIPDLRENYFSNKSIYLKKRLKFQNVNINHIHGLVFDIKEFLRINNITLESKMERIKDFIHSNFLGFLTENKTVLICRNIDENSSFKHLKIKIQESEFLDYYKINGNKYNTTNVIMAEGVFDIFNESIFDYTNLKSESLIYTCALSASYFALLDSIVFNENIYKIDAHILSDRDVPLEVYKKLKYSKGHILNSLNIYYNKINKDFGSGLVVPEKFII